MTDEQKELLANLRDALLPPSDAIATTSDLLKDVDNRGSVSEEYFEDVEKIHSASTQLYHFVKEQLTPGKFPDERDFDKELRTVRHDIKNRLNHITGPCQFLLLDYPNGSLGRDLKRVLKYSDACLNALNQQADVSAHEFQDKPAKKLEAPRHLQPIEKREVAPAHVLVADDNETNREILERFLTRQNHTVTFACNGREALEHMEQESFDLVLLDIIMPEVDGFQVLEDMHKSGRLRYIPVIVLTGLEDERDAVHCIEMGAEDFLSRPVNLDLLKARVDSCLEKKRLREKHYEQYFPAELARQIARHPDLLEKMESKAAEVTVLFCDIRSFSSISERLGPADTMKWLRDVMGVLSECVIRHDGVLVDYTGDELMAMWGAPKMEPQHANLACTAAIDMLAELPKLDRRWKKSIDSPTAVGIGINTGDVFVGDVGTKRKFKYGPLGNTVNLASRVQGATKYLRSTVLITGQTQELIDDKHAVRQVCKVKVNNIEEPVELFQLSPPRRRGWKTLKNSYEEALEKFYDGDFRKASSILGNILVKHPNDGPSLVLMSRAVESMLTSGESFDPVWTLPGK